MHDQELIQRCLNGQPDLFGVLVERYQQRLFHSLRHVLGSADDAQDVAQDAFLQAYQKLDSFRGQAQFYSWLFRIALNAAATARRKTRRVPASIEDHAMVGFEPADASDVARPEHRLESAERQAAVQRALAGLSDEFRTVLVLKEIDGLRYEEIAEIVCVPVGTIRSRLHRGRQELRESLRRWLEVDAALTTETTPAAQAASPREGASSEPYHATSAHDSSRIPPDADRSARSLHAPSSTPSPAGSLRPDPRAAHRRDEFQVPR